MTASNGRVWTGVLRIGPHQRHDAHVALRAMVTVAVPLLVLWAIGRLDLSIYASFGAFAALYGRTDGFADRMRMQAGAGAVLVAAMLVGTGLSYAGAAVWVSVLVLAAVAAGVTLLAYAMQWHPPGALFTVFAAGATATIPATTSSFGLVLLVGGGTVLVALLCTVLSAIVWRPPFETGRDRLSVGAVAWEMALTVGAAALIAGAVGVLLGSHWYWATVSAVAAVGGAHVTARLIRGVQRLAGTLVGIAVAAGVLALGLPPLTVILIAIVLQGCAEMFVARNYAIGMVFVTPLALLMIHLVSPEPVDVLLRDRALETVVGVAAGTLVAIASAAVRRARR